jgi:hypothetical protein
MVHLTGSLDDQVREFGNWCLKLDEAQMKSDAKIEVLAAGASLPWRLSVADLTAAGHSTSTSNPRSNLHLLMET